MALASLVLAALVAVEHVYFLVLEMILWRTPFGLRTFGMDAARAETTATLAMNQGLYNGFLAAGLVWSLLPSPHAFAVRCFFLGCVIVAGLFGGITVSRRIAVLQALPAVAGLVITLLAR